MASPEYELWYADGTHGGGDRESLPPPTEDELLAGYKLLRKQTEHKFFPGESNRRYLLYRGMSLDEYRETVYPQDGEVSTNARTSWTTNPRTAMHFAREYKLRSHDAIVVAAWVYERDIFAVLGVMSFDAEDEVIVDASRDIRLALEAPGAQLPREDDDEVGGSAYSHSWMRTPGGR